MNTAYVHVSNSQIIKMYMDLLSYIWQQQDNEITIQSLTKIIESYNSKNIHIDKVQIPKQKLNYITSIRETHPQSLRKTWSGKKRFIVLLRIWYCASKQEFGGKRNVIRYTKWINLWTEQFWKLFWQNRKKVVFVKISVNTKTVTGNNILIVGTYYKSVPNDQQKISIFTSLLHRNALKGFITRYLTWFV